VPDPELIITTTNKVSDVTQIIYGLSIRGVRAGMIESDTRKSSDGKRVDPYQIVLDAPTAIQKQIAHDSIKGIWDAILDEYERAVNLSGRCYFCEYDVNGLPRPTVCPECGVDLDSIQARRAMRDRRKP